jgi:hypothetical protein
MTEALRARDAAVPGFVDGRQLTEYADRYAEHFAIDRDAGILTVRMHTGGGAARFSRGLLNAWNRHRQRRLIHPRPRAAHAALRWHPNDPKPAQLTLQPNSGAGRASLRRQAAPRPVSIRLRDGFVTIGRVGLIAGHS